MNPQQKKIAEVIKKHKLYGDKVAAECIANDIADIYEEEDRLQAEKKAYHKKNWETWSEFNKTEWLKTAGAEG